VDRRDRHYIQRYLAWRREDNIVRTAHDDITTLILLQFPSVRL